MAGVTEPADVAVLLVDAAGLITAAEGAVLAGSLGVPADGLAGRNLFELAGTDARLAGAVERAMAGTASRFDLEVGDSIFEVGVSARAAGGAVVIAADVTVRRSVERESELERRYCELVYRRVPGAVWATDSNLRITHARGRVFALGSRCPRDALGMTVQEFVCAGDPTEPAVARHRAALAGEPQAFRYEFRGSFFQVAIDPLRDVRGRVVGCVGTAIDMTERTQLQAELAGNRARLEEAQRVAHIGSFEWDIESDAVRWSAEMHRIYGVAEGQFGGTYDAFLEQVHPDDVEHTRGVLFEAFRSPGPFEYDHKIVRPDGSVRVLHTRGELITEEHGKPLRLVGSCWDVTEPAELAARLRESVSVLEATIDAVADGILVVDRDGKVVAYNDRFVALWKVPPELARRRDDEALLAYVVEELEDPDEFIRGVRELYARSDEESFDVLRFKDGRVFERYSLPQRIGERVAGRVWSFHDVTDRERLLRRAEFLSDATRLLASLELDEALDGVARLAVPSLGDGCAIDLLGDGEPRRLVLVSRDPARPLSPELHAGVLAGHPLLYTVDSRSYMAAPLLIKGAVAGALTFLAAPSRQYGPQELALAEELARRTALSVENARLYRRAQEALRARDEFLAIAAHEIRGPTTAMHLAVQGLQRARLDDAAAARMLAVIEREDVRLARFVEELLDVCGIRRGGLRFTFEEIELGQVVRDAASRLAGELARSGSSLSVTSSGSLVGEWDRARLDQVVTNLLSNAIKFGGGNPIEVSLTGTDGRATLAVRDHGMGIPPELVPRIFSPFERAVSARHYGGLGLGLYIVRTIVEGLRGTVTVDSRLGDGSTFTVELPGRREG